MGPGARLHGERALGWARPGLEQAEYVPAEAPADDPSPDRPRVTQALHGRLDGRGGDRKAVAQAGMGGVQQLAHAHEVAVVQRLDGVAYALVLGDDMPDAIGDRLGKLLGHPRRRLAQA